MSLQKLLLVVAVTLFVASVLGAFAALGVFFRYDTDFWGYFDEGPVLKVAAVILSGLSVWFALRPLQEPGVVHDLRGDDPSGLLRYLSAQPGVDSPRAVPSLKS